MVLVKTVELNIIQMLKYGKYLNMKYAKIEDNMLKYFANLLMVAEEVSDDVFADMIKEDGTFDYTEEFKIVHKLDI